MAIVRAIKYGSKLIKKGSTGKPTRVKAGPTTRKDIQSTKKRGSVKNLNSTSNSGGKPSNPTKKITQQTPPRSGQPGKTSSTPKSPKAKPRTFTKADALKTGVTVAGITAIANRSTKKEAPKAAPVKKIEAPKPTRRAGPSEPTMTSMKAPSTGPTPRNKDEKKKPRRPSGPTMTSFKR